MLHAMSITPSVLEGCDVPEPSITVGYMKLRAKKYKGLLRVTVSGHGWQVNLEIPH